MAAKEVYCSLLMNDAYLSGALVLAHSLRDSGTKKQLAILVTLDTLSASTIGELKKVYDHLVPVERIVNKSPANLYLMNRPDLISTFTKIALWRQTQFDHIVYIDADVVALRAPDELFDTLSAFAAVPDIGWPDCFNSGVLSLKPNMGDYYALLALAESGTSFDGADQGLLNMHFKDWERLSFTYNCTPSGNYQYVPAYRHFQSSISLVHYIGPDKPWVVGRDFSGASVYEELLGRWWAVHDKHYRKSPTSISESTQQREVNEVQEVTPTAEHRPYTVDWNPAHQPPPVNSQPEAANFPNQIYSMSQDPSLFLPPKNPEPPKGLYYEVPPSPFAYEALAPIFPWESTAPKATRVFAEETFPNSPPPFSASPTISATSPTQQSPSPATTTSPQPSSPRSPEPVPFAAYARTNAWDDIPQITAYITSLPQNRRFRAPTLPPSTFPPPNTTDSDPPLLSPQPTFRRPSLKLTDFPTEIERPSLPVTPAPVRRPSFWGAERDAQGELPAAEGVPDQSEWDPEERLEALQRRQSEVLALAAAGGGDGTTTTGGQGLEEEGRGEERRIPNRELLGSSFSLRVPPNEVVAGVEGVRFV